MRFGLAELYTEDELRYFREVAFGAHPKILRIDYVWPETDPSPNALQDRIVKWTGDIVYFIAGNATREDFDTVVAVASELSSLMPGIDFVRRQWQSRDDAKVAVFFIDPAQVPSYRPAIDSELLKASGGLTHAFADSDDYRVEGGLIFIYAAAPSDLRRQAIRRELTRLIGLLDTSWWYPDSVFYEGDSSTRRFADIDSALIRLLYDPRIKPGMTYRDVLELSR